MINEPVPSTPLGAFQEANRMAAELGLSLNAFCKAAGVAHSPVYRWREGKQSYNVKAFCELRCFWAFTQKRRRKAKK